MNSFLSSQENNQSAQELWFGGRRLIWLYSINRPLIALKRLKERVIRAVDVAAILVAVIGWFSLVYWIFLHRARYITDPAQVLLIWNEKHPLLLIFLLASFANLFLIYRQSEKKAGRQKINYNNWFDKSLSPEEQTLPLANGRGKDLNAFRGFSDEAVNILDGAYLLARRAGKQEARPLHLFRALLKDKVIQMLFVRLDISGKDLVEKIDRHLADNVEIANSGAVFSDKTEQIFLSAFQQAAASHRVAVDLLDLLPMCAAQDALLSEILYDCNVDADKLNNAVSWFRINNQLIEDYRRYRHLARFKPNSGMNRSFTAIATPTLNNFSHDLTLAAKFGYLEMCVAREKEFSAIFEAFSNNQSGVLLMGHPGVGKRTMVEGLAQLMVKEEVPEFLKDKRLVELDISRLVSGASPSESQERLLQCIYEASRSGNIILVIQNIENLMGISAGGEGSLDLSDVLSEALSRGEILCLATISQENYVQYVEGKALAEALALIKVEEPTNNQAILMLESKVSFLEGKHHIYFIYDAIASAVEMTSRYLHERFLPLKAIEILQSASVIAAKKSKRGEGNACSREEVALAISNLTGISANKITESEGKKLLGLEESMHRRLIGQEEAVAAVASSLRRARVELKDVKRPIASFLFLGPTGVGKTELAKTVAETYFGNENYMIRLDMSEYQRPDSVSKMIGDSDGSLGYLTEAVRKKPFALVLLDEIEKAHPDILNLFLQLLDDGRLTDGQGRTISFTESIIIATSNIGALYIQQQIQAQATVESIKRDLIDNQLTQFMRPELVNRFDGIIVFKPLGEEQIFTIAKIQLDKIRKSLAEKGIGLRADKTGVQKLASQGYDPKFGARPLKRLLQERVEDPIANLILAGELRRRDEILINPDGSLSIQKGRSL